ncbi:L-ascorbate oxidase [Pseudomassariella vexata]|uniref:L-ascorbate oxidase n=1 Tax=Pseudomassariella vexata TaxID=1141098 RepID=A0A1Y2DNK4_9PEZI|nr:L-ascorbate oxidase [Pseudomassariella vexata]ORY60851.1 L-ascorbate oxidase [Pseudomassariella vexata]
MRWYFDRLLFLCVLSGLLPACCAVFNSVPHDETWKPEYVLIATAQNGRRLGFAFTITFPTIMLRLYVELPATPSKNTGSTDKKLLQHWHGLSLRTAPFADGAPLVSQWPIAPMEFFDYEVHPEAGDAGTYFYHSHVGFQEVTAHGLLIVDGPSNATTPYAYDDDIPFIFGDVYESEDEHIEAGLIANPFKWSGEPAAIDLNGKSGITSFSDATDESCTPEVITVEPGKTYRLRFVGVTALSFVMVGIEGHDELTIIEADGQYTKPATTDHIQIGSGQRFSALLKTKTQEQLDAEGKTSYWIRYENRDRPTNISGYALLDLLPDLPVTSPVTLTRNVSEYTSWMEYTLETLAPLDVFPTASEVTRTVYITVRQRMVDGFFNGTINGAFAWVNNNLTWQETTLAAQHFEPYLITAYKTGQVPDYDAALANNGWDPATRAFPALVGEVLDIIWLSNSGPTGGYDNHPMHAHGPHYWDLGSGNGTYDPVANEAKFQENGYIPAKRDTTQLYRYVTKDAPETTSGWRGWRIRVTEDDVGAWMMHCHVLGHMIMGMQTVWVFGNATDILTEIPQPYLDGYLEFGGSAYGNASYDPLVVEAFD